ncbi:hypothetical protein FB451DRAFT_1392784 [Mycena latifolia]|nr:hypothetical protein FB451DRAFT_1392784 [Mycena latifolia]
MQTFLNEIVDNCNDPRNGVTKPTPISIPAQTIVPMATFSSSAAGSSSTSGEKTNGARARRRMSLVGGVSLGILASVFFFCTSRSRLA